MIKQLKLLLAGVLLVGSMGIAGSAAMAADFDLIPKDACEKAKAQDVEGTNPTACQEDTPSKNNLYGPDGIVSLVVNILAIAIGVAAVIVMVIAGIQYMVSTGDPTKVNNAKNAIIYAMIGLGVAVFARIIVVFVIHKL